MNVSRIHSHDGAQEGGVGWNGAGGSAGETGCHDAVDYEEWYRIVTTLAGAEACGRGSYQELHATVCSCPPLDTYALLTPPGYKKIPGAPQIICKCPATHEHPLEAVELLLDFEIRSAARCTVSAYVLDQPFRPL